MRRSDPLREMAATTDAAAAFLLVFFVPLMGQALLLMLGFRTAAVKGLECGLVLQMFGIMLLCLFAGIRNEGLALRLRGNVLRTLLTYFGFSLLWVPFSLMLYPVLLRGAGHDLPAQPALLYMMAPAPLEGLLVVISLACVFAPIGEELFFRGYIHRFVAMRWGQGTALVVTSVWFGIMHGLEYALPLTLIGFLFGYLRQRTGGLAAPILAHMLHNSLTVGCALLWPELFDQVYDALIT
ncbi:MAG: lysostaphin resistance A-like protein [Planctomycetota bacterium]